MPQPTWVIYPDSYKQIYGKISGLVLQPNNSVAIDEQKPIDCGDRAIAQTLQALRCHETSFKADRPPESERLMIVQFCKVEDYLARILLLCMPLPANLNTLLEQINKELNNLDLELYQAIELVRKRLILFPDNIVSIQLFVTLNNYALFAENTKRRIQEIIKYLAANEILAERDIQEAGEDLSEQLGRILEAKIIVNNIKIRLEN